MLQRHPAALAIWPRRPDPATLLELRGEVLADLDRVGAVPRLCPDELAYALFFDQSTRTRSAWAGAAARLGMHPVIVDGSSTQVAHGETAAETGAMLGMNAHALGVRHDLILGEGNRFLRDVQTARGYEPVTTRSLHWIPDPGFRRAVADYLKQERAAVAHENAALATLPPFRKDN